MSKPGISILLLSLNEEENLPRCLDAVSWCEDILLVDSFSTDRSVEIAKERGARVAQRKFVNFADQRNFGLDHDGWKHDWVLHLDADEIVSPELRTEMEQCIQNPDYDAYRIASKMMFHGKWLRRSGMFPWHQVRLGRRDKLRFVEQGHGQREALPHERIGTLAEPFIHYTFSKGLADWVERHNRYSSAEAAHALEATGAGPADWAGVFATDGVRRRRACKQVFTRLPCRPLLRFLYMYVARMGFLDGRAGWHYCCLLAVYEWLTVMKIRELRRRAKGEPV